MAEKEVTFAEVMNQVEAEPVSRPAGGVIPALTTAGPAIPARREQLAILVSTGKAKTPSECSCHASR